MLRTTAPTLLLVVGATTAMAQGVNQPMVNGQQGYPQPYIASTGSSVTPNASAYAYQRRFYHDMVHPPRVHGTRRYHQSR
jgi:hypothetical protein